MKAIKNGLLSLIVSFCLLSTGFSQAPQKREAKREMHKEVQAYFQEHIVPVVKPLRESFDAQLTASEREELAGYRDELHSMKEEMRAKRTKGQPHKKPEELTEAEREEFRSMRLQRRKVQMAVWSIADAHEAELEVVMDRVRTFLPTWRSDLEAIRAKYESPQTDEQQESPRRGRYQHRMKGLLKVLNPTGFLLWDTEKPAKSFGKNAPQVFPNPSNGTNQLKYQLDKPGQVVVTLMDKDGLLLEVLMNEQKVAGEHIEQFDVSSLQPGIYYYQLQTEAYERTTRFMVE
ncbi:MAG: T9SS type A sorting domain-containing protein [Bacteroidota bacterium]